MIRYGIGILAAGGIAASLALVACGEDDPAPVVIPGGSGGGVGAGGAGTGGGTPGSGATTTGSGGAATAGCVGGCCPSDNSCYSNSSGKTAPGAECLARHINPDPTATPGGHITMRQTWIRVLTPEGNTIPQVYGPLNAYTTLPGESACNGSNGASGYMQITDMDLTNPDKSKHTSTVGYATYIPKAQLATTIAEGACFAEVDQAHAWTDKMVFPTDTSPVVDFSLPAGQMSSATGGPGAGPAPYPKGLPAPQPQPWTMGPTKAIRLAADFNLATDREAILGKLAADGEYGSQGYKGVFHFDEATGKIHGYSPVSWQIIYDQPTKEGQTTPESYILIPIREAELRFTTNNPKQPTCIGKYRADAPRLVNDLACVLDNDATDPPWGGIFNTAPGESDAKIQGYFLITELEQIYSYVLKQTLCVHYPTLAKSVAAGFGTAEDRRCRAVGANWDPATGKMPKGDWCAATNSPATETCYDAYRSESWHAFQAFKVKSAPCPAL